MPATVPPVGACPVDGGRESVHTVVLPGHGPTTTIGRERASNPFLVGINRQDGDDATPAAPHRGL